jgi:hypothetical protein
VPPSRGLNPTPRNKLEDHSLHSHNNEDFKFCFTLIFVTVVFLRPVIDLFQDKTVVKHLCITHVQVYLAIFTITCYIGVHTSIKRKQ